MSGAEISFGVKENRRPSKQVCQNGYSKKSTSKTSLTRSRIPCKQFVKYRASKRNISPKTGRQSLYTSPICEFCRTLSEKTLGIKPTKRPTERAFALCLRDTAPLLRRTVSRSAKRVAVAGRADLCQSCVTASRTEQAGGLRPSGLTSKPCAASRAKKASGLPPSERNCTDSAHRLKYGGAKRGPRFRRKTGVRKLPRGCEKQRTRTKQRAGTVD